MIVRALFDALLMLVAVWFIDRRLARMEYWLTPEPQPELPPSTEPLATVDEWPTDPVPCPVRRGNMRCTLADGHEGEHVARTGVSWSLT